MVYMSPFKVGVSSVIGSESEGVELMLPAPPRPWDNGALREEEELRRPVSASWGRAAILLAGLFCLRVSRIDVVSEFDGS